MNKIQSFKNAQEFQELFGIQEHNNGVKSRRNKILLALLKSKTVWAYCRERDDWSLLAIKSMAELKATLTKMIADAGAHQGLDYTVVLNGATFHSDTYETDAYNGVPEDGSIAFVRYINHDNNDGVFKMRAGRFYSKPIDETNIGQALPQQVKTWLCEEFSQDWQVYIAGTLPNFTLLVGHDFAEIYSGEACSPGMNSCMTDRGFHTFYRDSVKAKAARLVDEDGIILARCIIFTEVFDEEEKLWRLAERQYAKDQSDILKRALVDSLIKAGEIDGYKQVGADCGSSRAFVDIEGNSLSHKMFRIVSNTTAWTIVWHTISQTLIIHIIWTVQMESWKMMMRICIMQSGRTETRIKSLMFITMDQKLPVTPTVWRTLNISRTTTITARTILPTVLNVVPVCLSLNITEMNFSIAN